MAPLFQFNFDKPGPGIPPDMPRKTGYHRFEELLLQNGDTFFKAGLLAGFCFLPFYFGLSAAISLHQFPLMIIATLLGGAIAGPAITGLADTILRAQRDEPGIWWLTYKDAWKKNWKASLVPGALVGFLFGSLIFGLVHLNASALSIPVLIGFAFSALLCFAVFTYLFPQIALFDMPLRQILHNTLLLTLRHPRKTLGGALLQAIYWGLFLAYYPFTQILLPLTGLWFPMFMGLSVVYPPMEKEFDLENLVKKHQEESL
jgi:uncharacterized membrane protein YesL